MISSRSTVHALESGAKTIFVQRSGKYRQPLGIYGNDGLDGQLSPALTDLAFDMALGQSVIRMLPDDTSIGNKFLYSYSDEGEVKSASL